MLQELVAYGDTGKVTCLPAILFAAIQNPSFGSVPDDVVTKVIPRFIETLKSTSIFNCVRDVIWQILLLLCSTDSNAAADNFKRKLETSSILYFIIHACENYQEAECHSTLGFLLRWVEGDDKRKSMVLKRSRLFQVLFRMFDAAVARSDHRAMQDTLSIFASTLDCTGPIDAFLAVGGLAKLHSAFEGFITRGMESYHETGQICNDQTLLIGKSAIAIGMCHAAIIRRIEHLRNSNIARSLLSLTSEGLHAYANLLHNVYDTISVRWIQMHVIYNLVVVFALVYPASKEDEEHLLLSPGPVSGLSMALKCVRDYRKDEEFTDNAFDKVVSILEGLSAENPAILAEVEQGLSDKLVSCSLPGCNVSN